LKKSIFTFSILLFLISIIKKKTKTKYKKKKSKRYFFYLGCAFGFGFFLFGNYWISISLTHEDMFIGLIPFSLVFIPLLEKYVTKSRYHIAIGDHDDLKKDLEKEHR